MPTNTSAVATFIRHQIAICGRTQKEIADELGYPNPNIISMFKNAHTKVPPGMAGKLANALGCEPAKLLRLVLAEYEPDLLADVERILLSQPIVTQDDLQLIAMVRHTVGTYPLDLSEPWALDLLQNALQTIATRGSRRRDATIEAFENQPRNGRVKP